MDPNCAGAAQIFVGFAVFIDGARPDVAAAFPTYPAQHAGRLGLHGADEHAAESGERHVSCSTCGRRIARARGDDLGTRTMTCANATRPSRSARSIRRSRAAWRRERRYVNFGWVLTPLTEDDSRRRVDDHRARRRRRRSGTADYNHFRSGHRGDSSRLQQHATVPIGFQILDTTALTNGMHTISWIVTDNQGATEGIGSRFFTVSNGAGR